MQVTPPPEPTPPAPQAPPQEIHGFPLWIKIVAVAVAVLVIFSMTRIGPVLRDAINEGRGQKALASGQFLVAEKNLAPIVAKYPESTDTILDLTQAQIGANHMEQGFETLKLIVGRKVSKEQTERADQYAEQLGATLHRSEQN